MWLKLRGRIWVQSLEASSSSARGSLTQLRLPQALANQPRTSYVRASLCFQPADQKAIDLLLCPRQILVLDITPCDTIYNSMPLHKNFTKVAEKAILRLKRSVRSVFQSMWTRPTGLDKGPASMLPAGRPRVSPDVTPSWALTIHTTGKARSTRKLRAVLSKYHNLTGGMHSKPSAASNDASISSSAVSVAATEARAEEEAMGAVVKAAREGVNILVNMPRSWCTAPGQNSAVDAINLYHHRPRKFTYL